MMRYSAAKSWLVGLAALVLFATTGLGGCGTYASNSKKAEKSTHQDSPVAADWMRVKTIRLVDETSKILLASSEAKFVGELIEIGLREKGYTVCRECDSDAVGVYSVTEYKVEEDYTRSFLVGGIATRRNSMVGLKFRFFETASNAELIADDYWHEQYTDIKKTAGEIVTWMVGYIPKMGEPE